MISYAATLSALVNIHSAWYAERLKVKLTAYE